MQARAVFQWQLDHAKGVAPAQIIFSGVDGQRTAIVLASAVPAAYAAAFPRGVEVNSTRWGGTTEIQLPTRWFTLVGNAAGVPVVAPQRPVRTNGGFANLGLPLSRWFNANPTGRNAGWQLYLHYGIDQVDAGDLFHVTEGGAVAYRARSRLAAATIYYKVNPWCTFAFERSLYTTIGDPTLAGVFVKVAGTPSREWNDRRDEFGPVFTF